MNGDIYLPLCYLTRFLVPPSHNSTWVRPSADVCRMFRDNFQPDRVRGFAMKEHLVRAAYIPGKPDPI